MRTAALCCERGVRAAMATVLECRGSTAASPGQKLLLTEAGACVGSVGGGAIDRDVIEHLGALLRESVPRHAVHSFDLESELGRCWGGGLQVLIEPFDTCMPCVVVGAERLAGAVLPLLERIGFEVTVVSALPDGTESRGREPCSLGDELPGSRGVCVVIDNDIKQVTWQSS
jgi:xanthine dehydrogenase accessory factor